MKISDYRVKPDKPLDLSKIPTEDDGGLERKEGEKRFRKLRKRLGELQELHYAERKRGMLIALQGMDTSGKDSTIRTVFSGVGPAGVKVVNFKKPNSREIEHDYLWRVHPHAPRTGRTVLFNRSHYEDVLIVRVNELVPKERWEKRYDHINDFERMLTDEGATIVKFFLHISKAYQKQRLQRRLDRPEKHWKFDPGDLPVREKWDDYQQAYQVALQRCSPKHAPWYVIPAERRWFRNLLIARILVETFEGLNMQFPEPDFDPKTIVIPD